MITEQQLKADCTPDIIKKMVELTKVFEYMELPFPFIKYNIIEQYIDKIIDSFILPLLIHRAVEGWNKNKKEESILKEIIVYDDSVKLIEYKESREGGFEPFAIVIKKFENYQPSSFTPCECACLHCLIEVLG
jgi:hypothetical protein